MKDDFVMRVNGAELFRVLRNIVVFACTDKTLPKICCVYVEMNAGQITAAATDRYVLAWEPINAVTASGSGRFLLSTADVKTLTANKAWDSPFVPVSIDIDAIAGKVTFDADSAGSAAFATPDIDNFPKSWRKLAETPMTGGGCEAVWIDLRHLVKFAKVDTGQKVKNGSKLMLWRLSGASEHKKIATIVEMGEFRARLVSVEVES